MQKIYIILLIFFSLSVSKNSFSQSVLNPNDAVVTYNSNNPPAQPPFGQIGKWVRTKRLSWNTDSYKAYIYKGCAFRLKFPKSYNPSVNDGKKYPMIVFFHGLGETGSIYDNEYQLYHGGQGFASAVDNGTFDGFILCMQSQGFWGVGQYQYITEIIDYMVANNKLDPFHVVANGLSAGGQGTWEMLMNHPNYLSADLPMSEVSIGYMDTSVVNNVKFTPMWYFQGGLDGAPAPSTAQQVRDAILNAGGNFKYTEYSDLGHGTWDRAWSEPDFYPFILRSYSSNPWPLYGRTEFCSLDSINATLGLARGYDAYQWRKDSEIIEGANLNTFIATQPGTYYARVLRGSEWSDWSHTPVVIQVKTSTPAPEIQVSGMASRVLPALDGSTTVQLEVPGVYSTYLWQKVGSTDTISTTRFATVSTGDYKVKVSEQFGCSSSFSNVFSVIDANGQDTPDPASALIATTISKTAIKLNWTDNPSPAYNETNFEVYQALQPGGAYQFAGITGSNVNTITINGLNSNSKYYFKVRAINNSAASTASNEASATTAADTQAPTTPANLAISGSTANSISLAWNASSDDVGVFKYDIYINDTKSYATGETQFTVNNLQAGQEYKFVVKARDAAGNVSEGSNEVSNHEQSTGLLNFKYYTFTGTWNNLPDFNSLTPKSTGTVSNITLDNRTQDDYFSYLWEGYINIPVSGTYYFRTNSDDGSKVYLGALNQTASPYSFNANAIVNNDGLHSPQDKTSSAVYLSAGVYPIAITYYEQTGGQTMTLSWNTPQTSGNYVTVPSSAFVGAPQGGGGQEQNGALIFKYYTYSGSWSYLPNFSNLTPAATGTVPNITIDNATQPDNFAFLWEGFINISANGYYTFKLNSDDGSKLYLGKLNQTSTAYNYYATATVNNDGLHGAKDKTSSSLYLNQGIYPIAIAYYEQTGSSSISVSWKTPVTNGSYVIIPNSVFVSAPTGPIKYKFYTTTSNWSKLPDYNTLTPQFTGVADNISTSNKTQSDRFGYLWEGYINIPVTGSYNFRTNSDAGSKLYLGALNQITSPYNYTATPLVDNDGLHHTQDRTSSTITLTAGVYPIAISYFDQTGYDKITVSWRTPQSNGSYAYIPSSAFVDTPIIKITLAKPDNLTATALSTHKINLSWNDNSNNETQFEIWRSTDPNSGFGAIGSVLANTTNFTDSNLTTNTTYYYKIRAINNDGASDFDKTGNGINYSYYEKTGINTLPDFNSLIPEATGHTSTFGLGMQTQNDNFQFKFSGFINITTEGNYTFYTSSDDGSALYIDGFNENNLVVDNDGAHSAREKSGTIYLTAGLHEIDVTYMEITGNESLIVSYEGPGISKQQIPPGVLGQPYTSATTLATEPAPFAPGNLIAEGISTSSIKINWSDNSGNENNFELYRSGGNNTNYVLLATLPANVTSFTDSNLVSNTVYYYKILATNESAKSDYSNEDSAFTFNLPPVIAEVANQYVRYDTQLKVTVSGADADGNQLNFIMQNQPAFANIMNNNDETATLTFNPGFDNIGTYNEIAIIATDANGGSDTAYFTLNVGANYIPVISPLQDYVMSEGDTLTIPLKAEDQDTANILTWSVDNAPPGSVLTTVSNGNDNLFIKPGYAAAGVYFIKATVNDGNGGFTNTQIKLTVTDKDPNSHIYARFMDQDAAQAPWNNITGISTYNLLDSHGNNSHLNLELQTNWWAAWHEGPQTGDNSGVYPDAVLKDYYYFGTFGGPETVSAKLTGLDTSAIYNLSFYAGSNYAGAADNGTTTYTVDTITVSLAVQNNTQNTVSINSIKPAADGTITFTMAKGENTPVGYINALVISSQYDDKTIPATPRSLFVQNIYGNAVQLNWADIAYNESGYEVYRSLNAEGPYTKIGLSLPADATKYTDTTITGNTVYYYTVRAINGYGVSAFSDSVNITTADRVPLINPISDITIKNNQQVSLIVSAVDDTTDHIRLSASGLPPFAIFTDNGNGTGTINITPTLSTIGIYNGVTITAKDNSDSGSSASFNILVTDKDVSSVYLNFSDGSLAGTPWNNLTGWPFAGTTFNNLNDDSNQPSGVTVTLVNGFQGVVPSGMRPGNGKGVYPDVVMRTGEYEGSTNKDSIKISGLSNSNKYNFVFFNSHDDGLNGLTNFTINGTTVSLNATYNYNKTVQINGITPDANGNVMITVAKGAGADYAYISSLIIQGYSSSISTLSPLDLRVTDLKRTSVSLQWQDRAYNETGYEVWRASQNNNQYTLIKSLGANATTFTDAGLNQNSTYYYMVRAVKSGGYTNYSNTVTATTYAYSVYLNFTDANEAPAPWNNLNAVPQEGYTWNGLMDETNMPTNIGMEVTNTWAGLYSAGMNTTNNSGIYPDNVMIDSYGLFPGQTGSLKVTGLNISMKYDFTFFASTQAYGDVNVAYTINGKTVLLNTSLNTTGTVTLYGIEPDENGEVNISVTPGDASSQFGLIGAMIIQGFTESATIIPGIAQQQAISQNNQKQTLLIEDNKIELNAYPNPFSTGLNLLIETTKRDDVIMQLYDLDGHPVYQNKFNSLLSGRNLFKINLENIRIPSGMYLAKIIFINQNIVKTIKLFKQ